jgi:O-antigen ligase
VVILFVCAVFASYIAMAIQPLSGLEISAADRGVLLVLAYAGIALLAADGIATVERLESLMRFVVSLGAVVAMIGVAQFFVGFDIAHYFHFIPFLKANADIPFFYSNAAVRRVAGTAIHPIEFGVVLAFILPFAMRYAFDAPKGKRLAPFAKLGLILMALPMALSRSGALGATAAVVVLVSTWSWERRRTILMMLPVFLVGLRAAAPGLLGSLWSLFASFQQDNSIKHRTNDYNVVGQFISHHPLFGRGFGTFLPQKYFLLDNQYLGTIIELGFIGLGVVIALLVTGFFTARAARRLATNPVVKDLGQAFAASVAVAIVTFATFDFLGFQMATGMLFLVLGCTGALWRLARESRLSAVRTLRPVAEPVDDVPEPTELERLRVR